MLSGAIEIQGSKPRVEPISSAELAREFQVRNARVISLCAAALSLVGATLVSTTVGSLRATLTVLLPALGMMLAHGLAKRGRLGTSMSVLLCCIFAQHVGVVWTMRFLGATPFIAPVAILFAAATVRSRHLYLSFVGCALTIGIEGFLTGYRLQDRGALGTAVILAALTFVVSLLHTRGFERALAIAAEQALAREASAREALDTEKRFRLVAETADDLIALVRPTGETVFLSDSYARVFGVPISTLSHGRLTDQLLIANREEFTAKLAQAAHDGHSELEIRADVQGRGTVLLEAKMRYLVSDSGPLLAIISRDVTQQRLMQERLYAAERLEALGRLAGTVAHDFNNALTVIQGSTELVASQLPQTSDMQEDLGAVLKATEMATSLARQLLTFSRRELVVAEANDVASILTQQQGILSRLVGKSVRLECDLQTNLPAVVIPKTHVEQLAMNFVVNARDAMPAGGEIRISAALRHLADREVGDLVPGDYIDLRVQDTGQGIPPNVLQRIFEPSFSTKGSRGTGLGLATCQAIATQAGGKITVLSTVGQGTTFSVLLPVARRTSAPADVPFPGLADRRVLVVDDDVAVRDLIQRMLETDGFEVLTAGSEAEARSKLDEPDLILDALVTDVVLGTERGTNLLLDARAQRPRMRILVISGYTPEPEAARSLTKSGAAFLAKPFGREQLRSALVSGT